MVPPRDKKKRRTRNPPKRTNKLALEEMKIRKLHPEKEFPQESSHPFYKICVAKKYLPLLRKRLFHNETIVREFYAETRVTGCLSINFRGKDMTFNATTIQKYLQSPRVLNCSFAAFREDPSSIPWTTILETLTIPGASWRKNGNKFYLDRKEMKDETRVWLNFMCSTVKPRAHMSSISRDGDALLLYCLMSRDCPVDISSIASDAIISCAKSDTANLIFPHLISEMCEREGVLTTPEDAKFSCVRARCYSSMTANPASSRKRQRVEGEDDDHDAVEEDHGSKLDQVFETCSHFQLMTKDVPHQQKRPEDDSHSDVHGAANIQAQSENVETHDSFKEHRFYPGNKETTKGSPHRHPTPKESTERTSPQKVTYQEVKLELPQGVTYQQQALPENKVGLPQPVHPTMLSPSSITTTTTTPPTLEAPTSSSMKQHSIAEELDDLHVLSRRACLLDEAFVKYPHLWNWKTSQKSPRFCKWGYDSLTDMLELLKSEKPKTMDETKRKKFEDLCFELESFGFDKEWLASIHKRVIDLQVGHNEKLKELVQLKSDVRSLEDQLNVARSRMYSIEHDLSKLDDVFGL